MVLFWEDRTELTGWAVFTSSQGDHMVPPKAIIIASGSELLAGLHTDTNTQFLAQSLRRIGVGVVRTLIVGDAYNDLVDTFSYALDRAQVVVVSGGLGPTVDDLTREALSEATGI